MSFWGKLSEDRSQQLPLADHCIDVAAVFRALCNLTAIRRCVGLGENVVQMDRLAVFALLHDLGKCNTGFQAKRDPNARNIAGHVKETAALLYDGELGVKANLALGLEEIASWFVSPEAASRILLASIFHHGKPAFDSNIAGGIGIDRLKAHWLSSGIP